MGRVPFHGRGTELARGRAGIVPAGALCVEGECQGVVVAIGAKTVIGKMITNKSWPP